jgi:dihydropteroate synthase
MSGEAKKDPDIYKIAAKYKCFFVITHNRSDETKIQTNETVGNSQSEVHYENLLSDIRQELLILTEQALSAGISKEKIIHDPGFGFGKSATQNLQLLKNLDKVKIKNFPLLSGTSRKSFIGLTLGVPPEDRLAGSIAAATISVVQGADILRVHDIKASRQAADFSRAVRDVSK